MKKIFAVLIVFSLLFPGVSLALPGKAKGPKAVVPSAENPAVSESNDPPQESPGPGLVSSPRGKVKYSESSTPTPNPGDKGKRLAKGKKKFELEGKVVAVGSDSLSVRVKAATKSIKSFRGDVILLGVTGSTKISKKGKSITLTEVASDDRVHAAGRVDLSDPENPIFTATRIRVTPKKS